MNDEYPIPLWRTDDDGNISGYYIVEDVSGLGKLHVITPSANTDCSTYGEDAHLCNKKKWKKKGCCCITIGGTEYKIPESCNR